MKHCPGCDQDLLLQDFAWRNKAKGTRASRCRGCQKTASAAWYVANTERQKANVARNTERHLEAAYQIIYLAKSVPCADCGGTFPPVAMDFDHIRGDKVMDVSRMMRGYRLDRLRQEILKCEVVCAVCHRIRTAERIGAAKVTLMEVTE